MSSKLLTSINCLFTAILLVIVLISCQEIPPDNNLPETQLENKAE